MRPSYRSVDAAPARASMRFPVALHVFGGTCGTLARVNVPSHISDATTDDRTRMERLLSRRCITVSFGWGRPSSPHVLGGEMRRRSQSSTTFGPTIKASACEFQNE